MTLQSSHYVSFTLVLRWSYVVTKGTLCVLYVGLTLVLCRYKGHIMCPLLWSYVVAKCTLCVLQSYVGLMSLQSSHYLNVMFVLCRYKVHII